MKCLTPDDVPDLLGPAGFAVDLSQKCYRTALWLESEIAQRQRRVGASPPDDLRGLRWFLEEANRWLPSAGGRVLWIDHFETDVGGGDEFLLAMRRGFGELRGLADVPGHYVPPQLWQEQDQLLVTREHAAALSLLVGMATILLVTGSDGWLVGEGVADRIEFWEGNVFFHSADGDRLDDAMELLKGCRPVR